MSTQVNSCSELIRFCLEVRNGYLVGNANPAKVPYAISDISLVTPHPVGYSISFTAAPASALASLLLPR
jgi:hypothetical protein